jgi:deazaflavin-dependent oxidoreductase (nitroreductase family)
MRAHGGQLTSGPLAGHPLLVMTSTGARTGDPRRAILTYHRDGDAYVVAGTGGGSPTTPAWVHNVAEHPDVELEVSNERFPARAEIIADGPERERLWRDHVAVLPWFADYPAQTGRLIPMVRLSRAA